MSVGRYSNFVMNILVITLKMQEKIDLCKLKRYKKNSHFSSKKKIHRCVSFALVAAPVSYIVRICGAIGAQSTPSRSFCIGITMNAFVLWTSINITSITWRTRFPRGDTSLRFIIKKRCFSVESYKMRTHGRGYVRRLRIHATAVLVIECQKDRPFSPSNTQGYTYWLNGDYYFCQSLWYDVAASKQLASTL